MGAYWSYDASQSSGWLKRLLTGVELAEKDEGDLKFEHFGNPEVTKRGNNHVAGFMSLQISYQYLICCVRKVCIRDSLGLAGWILKLSSRSKSCPRREQLFPAAGTRWWSVLLCVRHALFDPTVYHKVFAASLEKSPFCSRWACPNSLARSPI